MRKAIRSITFAVGIGIGIFIDGALLEPLDFDGQKQVVVLMDSADSIRVNPKSNERSLPHLLSCLEHGLDGQKIVIVTDSADSMCLDPR